MVVCGATSMSSDLLNISLYLTLVVLSDLIPTGSIM